ncbi:golgin-84-like [Hibiscus syriacus]|uniref:golgin-84-like n=1 Tax=Hibiscus syriacus TaxID=106335 RepID=UPI0019220CB3|nr:golgin-84-like [Hibiscus syriacus]
MPSKAKILRREFEEERIGCEKQSREMKDAMFQLGLNRDVHEANVEKYKKDMEKLEAYHEYLKKERIRIQELETEMNDILESFKARGQRIQELKEERESKRDLVCNEMQGWNRILARKQAEVKSWMQRYSTKNSQIEEPSREIRDMQLRHEEEMSHTQTKNLELGDHVMQLEDYLYQEQVPPASMNLRLSREDNRAL